MKEKKSLRRSKGFKVLLVFMYLLGTGAAATGGCMTTYLYEHHYYSYDVEKLTHDLMDNLCADDMYELNGKFNQLREEGYFDEKTSENLKKQLYDSFMTGYSLNDTNFFFKIYDMEDNQLLDSYYTSAYQCSRVQVYQDTTYRTVEKVMTEEEYETFEIPAGVNDLSIFETPVEVMESQITMDEKDIDEAILAVEKPLSPRLGDDGEMYLEGYDADGNYYLFRFDEDGNPVEYSIENDLGAASAHQYTVQYTIPKTENAYYISGYVRENFTANDKYSAVRSTVTGRYNTRYVFPVCIIVGVVLMLVSLVFLVASAGYSTEQEAAGATIFEKIPFDLFTAAAVGIAVMSLLLVDSLANGTLMTILCIVSIAVIWGLLLLWWLMSIAMRLRTKTMLKNNLLYLLGKCLWASGKKGKGLAEEFAASIPFIWQAGVLTVVYLFLSIFSVMLTYSRNSLGVAIMVLLITAVTVGILFLAWNLHILEKGAQQLAEGNLTDKIQEKRLFGRFRKHAECLNSLGDGMNKAVSDRLKSEMFRTELISNVSHDIRTPLTSIINYTNLLSRLQLEDEQAKEYIAVLGRQSARLQKLTEDVLEASKATTGNVKVNKETMDIRVLLEQIEGEYCERLEENHLTLIKDIPDTPLYISADGRLLWRVMDNLFSNICKYAMEGTRVYLNILHIDDNVICMLRNISGAQLNISSEELMERFVRGDRSRNTEGSGLGLSIAQSLTDLQGGKLELQIDGDLFKVTIQFPSRTQDAP